MVTLEEGSSGGFGSMVMQHLAWRGLLDGGLRLRPMALPDRLIDHDSQPRQYDAAGLNAAHIVATVLAALGPEAPAAKLAAKLTAKPSVARTR